MQFMSVCIRLHVCMYLCTYVSIYAYTYEYKHLCIYPSMNVCLFVCTYAYKNPCIHIMYVMCDVCTYECLFCKYVPKHKCLYVYIIMYALCNIFFRTNYSQVSAGTSISVQSHVINTNQEYCSINSEIPKIRNHCLSLILSSVSRLKCL